MYSSFTSRTLYALLFALAFMLGCKDDEGTPQPAGQLMAKAGPDQSVQTGQTVTLDGSASSDSHNLPFSYRWAFSSQPAGSTASLQNATTATPSFVPDIPGAFELELTIANAHGESRDKVLVSAAAAQPLELPEFINVAMVLEDRIADPSLPDYIANKTTFVSAQLTIQPGVTIAFAADTRLDINEEGGVIIAKGTAEKKIRFVGQQASAGYWRGMIIYSSSSLNELDHVEIAHTGSQGMLSTIKAGLSLFGISQAQVALKNCSFTQNAGWGVHAASGASLRAFEKNSFSHNAEAGLLLAANQVAKLDAASSFTGNNGRNRVEVLASNLEAATGGSEIVWAGFADKTPYRVLGELRVHTGWKLKPGVTLEMGNDQVLVIESTGYLHAVGTAANKIIISGALANSGYWRGIVISSSSSQNMLEHTEIRHGGSYQLVSGHKANIALVGGGARLSITHSLIGNSAGYGIYVRHNSSINADVHTANSFEANSQQNVLIEE
ncbi:PKD domain-containing protein [Cesiribacter andamanensis]|nr:PKD domain-containing protein [Cesiribacter andamanensis]